MRFSSTQFHKGDLVQLVDGRWLLVYWVGILRLGLVVDLVSASESVPTFMVVARVRGPAET